MLPALRRDLEIMPSPAPEQPGLLMRDPMQYSDSIIIVPWVLARCLDAFDGEHSSLDLRAALVRETGQLDVSSIQERLIEALSEGGFLEDERFSRLRDARLREFALGEKRPPSHAGSGYPATQPELSETMHRYIEPSVLLDSNVMAIAAPHVSPFGGWESYQAAYRTLPKDAHDRTFVILGTSHYGEPDRFGLTRKNFETPLGTASTDRTLVQRLVTRAGDGVTDEDYCHSVEHSIEFQVLFLQWLYGPEVKVLPILCGSYARSIFRGGKPEANESVKRFLGELGEVAEAERDRLIWVLGIDMAHIGRRYGDRQPAQANQGFMQEVAGRDRARNERVVAGDADGFWELVQQNRDDLRWCGSAPLYTFLQAVPWARGRMERYEQWNIDEASVVSFAGISFTRGE